MTGCTYDMLFIAIQLNHWKSFHFSKHGSSAPKTTSGLFFHLAAVDPRRSNAPWQLYLLLQQKCVLPGGRTSTSRWRNNNIYNSQLQYQESHAWFLKLFSTFYFVFVIFFSFYSSSTTSSCSGWSSGLVHSHFLSLFHSLLSRDS